MTGSSATAEELALNAAAAAAGVQSINRAQSTFWQYPNALPIESVISMSPATVGLQYSREASRGQVVLLPATAAALDPFQPAAAAAFLWPSYIPQSTTPAQPPPNIIFPSMSPHSTLQSQPYATSLQLFGSNYLTAAAAAAAAAAATTTLCQHSQQQTSSTAGTVCASSAGGVSTTINLSTTSSASSTSRFLSLSAAAPVPVTHPPPLAPLGFADMQKVNAQASKQLTAAASTLPLPLPLGPITHNAQSLPLLLPPSAMKIEDCHASDFLSGKHSSLTSTAFQQQQSLIATAAPLPLTLAALPAPAMPHATSLVPPSPLNFEATASIRSDKLSAASVSTGSSNLLELQAASNQQALNLMRLPTPPTSATLENAVNAAAPLLFTTTPTISNAHSTPSTPALLNLNATLPRCASASISATSFLGTPSSSSGASNIGPPTPVNDDASNLNFKCNVGAEQHAVVGVPRTLLPAPQMQDVNIQTDTPVCSEDENSTGALMSNEEQNVENHTQQPLELTKTVAAAGNQAYEAPLASEAQTHQSKFDEKCHNSLNIEHAAAGQADSDHLKSKAMLLEQQFSAACMPTPNSLRSPSPELQQARCPGSPLGNNNNNEAVSTTSNSAACAQPAAELSGLELLSQLTSTLVEAKPVIATAMPSVRVKQEPIDHHEQQQQQQQFMAKEAALQTTAEPEQQQADVCTRPHVAENGNIIEAAANAAMPHETQLQAPPPNSISEPFGGLSLLCALAEQRIQEEVQSSSGLFSRETAEEAATSTFASFRAASRTPPAAPSFSFESSANGNACFPSMEGLELPSTSSGESPQKRKKHKHSKSSKSLLLSQAAVLGASSSSSSKKSCGKKNKKKLAKEKRRQRQLLEDAKLQEEIANLRAAGGFGGANMPAGVDAAKWPELFNMMSKRLADVTRQYHKKKRKLDEISAKNKKKKKCSKLAAAAAAAAVTAANTSTAAVLPHLGTSPLRSEYVGGFGKFSSSGAGASTTTAAATPYLQPSSFARCFAEKATGSLTASTTGNTSTFPPPAEPEHESDEHYSDEQNASDQNHYAQQHHNPLKGIIYKPVRLEPSSLDGSLKSTALLRHAAATKHSASEKPAIALPCKERKLMLNTCGNATSSTSSSSKQKHRLNGSSSSGEAKHKSSKSSKTKSKHFNNNNNNALAAASSSLSNNAAEAASVRKLNPQDCELMLTSEHLFRKETRVLTDMGGLFYAGIMKPLQPPDVYAITLDGERGNKSHIMSREEIFKDTILEVAPKSIESLPVGTRLCAYWSQQYRCLYPGRVIESESSDDDSQPSDFVSVEFDDGDSGRIRLQNIRLLLSNYPIVGKHKKAGNSFKSEHLSDHSSSAAEDLHHLALGGGNALLGCSSLSNGSTASGGTATELLHQSAIDRFQQRSEKKRIKSLKKKNSQAAAAAAAAEAGNAIAAVAAAGNGNDALRKHHKHKKRKKHKKHHHRKLLNNNNNEAGEANSNGFGCSSNGNVSCYADKNEDLSAKSKTSMQAADHSAAYEQQKLRNGRQSADTEADEELQQQDDDLEHDESTQEAELHSFNGRTALALKNNNRLIKIEAITPTINCGGIGSNAVGTVSNATARTVGLKVKTEHLEMEEESNLMSEVSEEVKGDDDEIEHRNNKGSKIAAFLPERQLWGWLGTAYRKAGNKGRARKQFYKSIKRGKETITVGECAVFLSTGRPDRPYIGRIESMWETASSNKVVRVRWFYHPEETTGCPDLKFPGGLFESPHEDENDVQTISHRCEVLPFMRYFGKFGADSKQYQLIYDNNDTYYLAGFYNPRLLTLKLQDDIPTQGVEQSAIAPVVNKTSANTNAGSSNQSATINEGNCNNNNLKTANQHI